MKPLLKNVLMKVWTVRLHHRVDLRKNQILFTSSLRGSDSNTNDVNNNGGDVSIIHTKSKHFNRESSNGDSENDTPFVLPFP